MPTLLFHWKQIGTGREAQTRSVASMALNRSKLKQATTNTRVYPVLITFLCSLEACGEPLRVAVLLSGGVDSSTAAALARAAGHHVEAFYLKIWFQEDFRNYWSQCPWEEDL